MSCQAYHGHSTEVFFRELSNGLQGMEVHQTLPIDLGKNAPEVIEWRERHEELQAASLTSLRHSIFEANVQDYRWRRREVKVIAARTGQVKWFGIHTGASKQLCDYSVEEMLFSKDENYALHRRLQRVIVAFDGPQILTDPEYRLGPRMRRGGITGSVMMYDDDVIEAVIARMEMNITPAQIEFMREHFPWIEA